MGKKKRETIDEKAQELRSIGIFIEVKYPFYLANIFFLWKL